MNKISYTGYWWLSDNTQDTVIGTLTIEDKNKFVLTLTGSDKDLSKAFPDLYSKSDKFEIPIINGFAKLENENKEESFCLQNSTPITMQSSRLTKVILEPENVLKKIHFNKSSDIRIQQLFLKFDHLDEWVNKNGFTITETIKDKFSPQINYTQPDPITLIDNSQYRIYLWFRARAPYLATDNACTISQSIYFNIELKRRQNIDNTKRLIRKLQDFFSFAISTPVGKVDVTLRKYSKRAWKKTTDTNQSFELLYHDIVNISTEKIRPYEMLIDYETLAENETNIINHWLENYDELASVMRLYFDTFYNKRIYPQTRFLNLIFALEIYHQNRINNKQVSFKTRLNEIFRTYSFIGKRLYSKREVFITKLVSTRNNLVHNRKVKPHLLIKETELNIYSEKLRILLEAVLLSEMGFDKRKIFERIKSANKFSSVINLK